MVSSNKKMVDEAPTQRPRVAPGND